MKLFSALQTRGRWPGGVAVGRFRRGKHPTEKWLTEREGRGRWGPRGGSRLGLILRTLGTKRSGWKRAPGPPVRGGPGERVVQGAGFQIKKEMDSSFEFQGVAGENVPQEARSTPYSWTGRFSALFLLGIQWRLFVPSALQVTDSPCGQAWGPEHRTLVLKEHLPPR